MLSLGMMSGTSMDGIDAALIETNGKHEVKTLNHHSLPYTNDFRILLKAAEWAANHSQGDLAEASYFYDDILKQYLEKELQFSSQEIADKLQHLACSNILSTLPSNSGITLENVIQHSTNLHAAIAKELIQQSNVKAKEVAVLGYHGQTLFHQPQLNISLQVGDGQSLANQLGIKVVGQFRKKDILAGGQGAPFAPLYHLALAARDQHLPAIVINCGGLANLSYLPSSDPHDVISFDTGPGNALIDRWVRMQTKGKQLMDVNGYYGSRGKVHENILQCLHESAFTGTSTNYLHRKPPKSLDYNHLLLIPELNILSLEDGCRTLEAFTAQTIIHHLQYLNNSIPKKWILAGGGWENPILFHELNIGLKNAHYNGIELIHAEKAGWHNKALEAEIFAYLAVRSLTKLPLSYPGTTGVPAPMSGGEIFEPETIL